MRLHLFYDPAADSSDVREECERQGFEPVLHRTDWLTPYAYADHLRELWRAGEGWIHVEQRALPPAGALAKLESCQSLACQHLHDCRRKDMPDTLALCRFSAELCRRYPDLADQALAERNWRRWWHCDMLNAPRWHEFMTKPANIEHATMSAEALEKYGAELNPRWPSTVAFPHMDTALWLAIRATGTPVHIHRPSVPHLRTEGDNREHGVTLSRDVTGLR